MQFSDGNPNYGPNEATSLDPVQKIQCEEINCRVPTPPNHKTNGHFSCSSPSTLTLPSWLCIHILNPCFSALSPLHWRNSCALPHSSDTNATSSCQPPQPCFPSFGHLFWFTVVSPGRLCLAFEASLGHLWASALSPHLSLVDLLALINPALFVPSRWYHKWSVRPTSGCMRSTSCVRPPVPRCPRP